MQKLSRQNCNRDESRFAIEQEVSADIADPTLRGHRSALSGIVGYRTVYI